MRLENMVSLQEGMATVQNLISPIFMSSKAKYLMFTAGKNFEEADVFRQKKIVVKTEMSRVDLKEA